MKIRIVIPMVALLASMSALASQCPKDIKQIDQALNQSHNLSSEQVTQVRALRDEGERLHQAGQHQQSVDTLAQALSILGQN